MTWFKRLTGIEEASPQAVRENLVLKGHTLKSLVNGREMDCGRLEIPSLGHLRQRVQSVADNTRTGKISVREIVSNVQCLHLDPENSDASFQVASQFNLLEMVGPSATPEQGVGIYENDLTQGPACAIAAGAGTIYRNYFAVTNGEVGQSADNQIDCLADIGDALGNSGSRLWRMTNGYALASHDGLIEISKRLARSSQKELDELRSLLRIGIQWDTEVTIEGGGHRVSQAYCSALPVAYSRHASSAWEPFARLILEASYEATLCAAILNSRRSGSPKLFLTLLGGGAFGNQPLWILDAIERALTAYQGASALDVVIVSYGSKDPLVQKIVDRFRSRFPSD